MPYARYTYFRGFTPMLFGQRMKKLLTQLLDFAERNIKATLVDETDDGTAHGWEDTVAATLTENGEAVLKLTTIVNSNDCAATTIRDVVSAMRITFANARRYAPDGFKDTSLARDFTEEELDFIEHVLAGDDVDTLLGPAVVNTLSGARGINPLKTAANKIVMNERDKLVKERDEKIAALEAEIEKVRAEYKKKIEEASAKIN